jgi:hypothetical protein
MKLSPQINLSILPIAPPAFADESKIGYLLRLSEAMHYTSPGILLNALGVRSGTRQLPSAELIDAMILPIVPRSVPAANDQSGLVSGQGKSGIQRASQEHIGWRSRICPSCLAEKAYLRESWSYRAMTACARHEVALIDRCPQCQVQLSWSRPGVCHCECGFVLTLASPQRVSPDSLAICTLLDPAASRLGSAGSLASPANLPLVDLAKLRIETLHNLIWYLGCLDIADTREFAKAYQSHPDMLVSSALVERAVQALSNWPTGFHNLLDRVRVARPIARRARKNTVMRQWFGHCIERLQATFAGDEVAFVKEAVGAYIAAHENEFLPKRRGRLAHLRASSSYITATEAGMLLGCSYRVIKKLVETEIVKGLWHSRGVNRKTLLVERASLDKFIASRIESVGTVEMTEALGLNREELVALIDAGQIEARKTTTGRKGHRYQIDRSGLDAYLERMFADVPDDEMLGHGELVSFQQLRHHYAGRYLSLPELADAVLSRRLRPACLAKEGQGFARLRFAKGAIKEFLEVYVLAAAGGMSLPQLARHLGWRVDLVHALCAKGLIATSLRDARSGLGNCVVPVDESASIRKRFVTLKELSREIGESSVRLKKRLAQAGIQPAVRRGEVRFTSDIYFRAEVTRYLDSQ